MEVEPGLQQLALGADGVWVGTRFIATPEANGAPGYRDTLLATGEDGTTITRAYSGKPMRVFKNDYVADWERRPQDIKPFPMQAMISHQAGVMGGIGGQVDGLQRDRSAFAMGQGAGAIHEVLPCAEIVKRMVSEAEEIIARMSRLTRAS